MRITMCRSYSATLNTTNGKIIFVYCSQKSSINVLMLESPTHKTVQNKLLVEKQQCFLSLCFYDAENEKLAEFFLWNKCAVQLNRSKLQLFRWLWQQRGLFLVNVFTLDVFPLRLSLVAQVSVGCSSSHPLKWAILSGLNEKRQNLFRQ